MAAGTVDTVLVILTKTSNQGNFHHWSSRKPSREWIRQFLFTHASSMQLAVGSPRLIKQQLGQSSVATLPRKAICLAFVSHLNFLPIFSSTISSGAWIIAVAFQLAPCIQPPTPQPFMHAPARVFFQNPLLPFNPLFKKLLCLLEA